MRVLRRKRPRSRADVEHHIRHALDDIRPLLRIEHCAIELQSFDPASGAAVIGVTGGCPDCEVSPVTFIQGIETHLKHRVAEVKSVVAAVAPSQ